MANTMNLIDERVLLDDDQRRRLEGVMADMLERMEQRNTAITVLRNYDGGNPPMPWVHAKARPAYAALLKQAVCNIPLLVIDAVADRLAIEGFRLDGQDVDRQVWRDVWQANSMDIFAPQVQREALVTGLGYVSTDGTKLRGEVTDEVFHDPDVDADPLTAARVVKTWANRVTKRKHLRYVDPDVALFLSAEWNPQAEPEPDLFRAAWTLDSLAPRNGAPVPFFPFLNRPTLDGRGQSEIADLLPHFDKTNTLSAQMLLNAELSAFKIRWATGLDVPTDMNGRPIEPFDVAVNRLWINRDPEGKFGSFEGTDLGPYMEAIDQAIQQIAAVSRTPAFLLAGKITNLSAEALLSLESGLVQKIRHRQRIFGESWQRVIRAALASIGDERAGMADMEVMWRDPENISEAQRVDALSKLHALGLPWRAVMERYGATPGEIVRWESQRADDIFQRMLLAQAQHGGLAAPPMQDEQIEEIAA